LGIAIGGNVMKRLFIFTSVIMALSVFQGITTPFVYGEEITKEVEIKLEMLDIPKMFKAGLIEH
jgi:hypothetical protein